MNKQKKFGIIIFVLAFSLGFLTCWGLEKVTRRNGAGSLAERVPVHPNDLSQHDLMGALHKDMLDRLEKERGGDEDLPPDFALIGPSSRDGLSPFYTRREDDKFVYYDLSLNSENGVKKELNVKVNNGMVEVTEKSTSENSAFESTRAFTIEPGLQNDQAQVLNEKDKVVIKIPKK